MSRFLAVTLIFSILLCPVVCNQGIGKCCVIQFATKSPAENKSQVLRCKKCCSNCESKPEKQIPEKTPAPRNCPCEEKSCQGICGGALIEQAELYFPILATPVPLSVLKISNVKSTRSRTNSSRQNYSPSGAMLRILHQSFTC